MRIAETVPEYPGRSAAVCCARPSWIEELRVGVLDDPARLVVRVVLQPRNKQVIDRPRVDLGTKSAGNVVAGSCVIGGSGMLGPNVVVVDSVGETVSVFRTCSPRASGGAVSPPGGTRCSRATNTCALRHGTPALRSSPRDNSRPASPRARRSPAGPSRHRRWRSCSNSGRLASP